MDKILCQQILHIAQDLSQRGLSHGKSGNLSARQQHDILITPSGKGYSTLEQADLVCIDLEGNIIQGEQQPSSEWPFHCALYQARDDIQAVVHLHSPYATAIACQRQIIPAFHYMVAIVGNNHIPCADYATFGSLALSENVVQALASSNACLLANHGMIAVGTDINNAYALAQEVENLAQQYVLSCALGNPVLLDDTEMAINLEKFKHYGK